MVKKAVLSLVLLAVLGAAVFAEYYNGYEYICGYIEGNTSSIDLAEFEEWWTKEYPESFRISKLPNSVKQVISHALEDYTLDVGDVFGIIVEGRDTAYDVTLRITNRNGTYEFIAYSRSLRARM